MSDVCSCAIIPPDVDSATINASGRLLDAENGVVAHNRLHFDSHSVALFSLLAFGKTAVPPSHKCHERVRSSRVLCYD